MAAPVLTPRQAISSKEYAETASLDLFANLDVDVATECEETKEDAVILTLEDGRYEILPFSQKRVVVKRYFEKTDVVETSDLDTTIYSPQTASRRASGDPSPSDSPNDRTVKEQANRILAYERTTRNPTFLKAVEKARLAPREITFKLPQGRSISWRDKKRIEKMLTRLLRGDLEGALKLVAKVGPQPKTAPSK